MKKEDVKTLRNIFYMIDKNSNDTTQVFLKVSELLEYLGGHKTQEFNNKIEKKYSDYKEQLKEMRCKEW